MQAFLDLLGAGKLDMERLITHTFSLEKAPEAYQIILDRSEPFVGMLLEYGTHTPLAARVEIGNQAFTKADINIGFLGAGSFAQNILLPAVEGQGSLIGVATARPNNARYIADKY